MKRAAISTEGRRAVRAARPGIAGVLLVSFFHALFPIAAALFVLLLFDVALPGRSIQTLVGIVVVILLFLGMRLFLGVLRQRMLHDVAAIVVQGLGGRIDAGETRLSNLLLSPGHSAAMTRDLRDVQTAIPAAATGALLDLAGTPILVLALVFFHGWLAFALFVACGIFAALLWRAYRRDAGATDRAERLAAAERAAVNMVGDHGDVIRALGIRARASRIVLGTVARLHRLEREVGGRGLARAQVARALALFTLFAMLSIGAALAIFDKASDGVIVASGVLGWLAVQPFVVVIANAPVVAAGRSAWRRIDDALAGAKAPATALDLPRPVERLECESIGVVDAENRRPLIQNVSFALSAGDVLVVAGPSGAGKSTLLRVLAGATPASAGKVRLDGGAYDQWTPDGLGRLIGYHPQGATLFDGSVAENIARLDPAADSQRIVDAAQAADAHEMILRLPQGYATNVTPGGSRLAAAQRQRIAMARALYGDPFLLVLDDIAAHLDVEGEQALIRAVTQARARGAITIIGGNSRLAIDLATQVLLLRGGNVLDFGPKDDVRERMSGGRKKFSGEAKLTSERVSAE